MAEAKILAARPPGLLHALAYPGFATIAVATLVSSIGVWMRDTTSAWTVATHGRASAVALVQTATTLPTLVLALPAGVLADHFDKRRILILCQLVMAAAGVALAALSAAGLLDVALIVALALVAGSAAAVAAPAFQAIVPALVPADELRSAVALSSISFNVARVIGPAVGGLVLAAAGPAAAYLANAIGYAVTIAALVAVRLPATPPNTDPIDLRAELHDGLAFAAKDAAFRHVVARGMGLYLCAACYLTLTPLLGQRLGGQGPGVYGTLLAAIGVGSLVGGVLLSMAHRFGCDDDRLLRLASAGGAAALALLAVAPDVVVASVALGIAGAATLVQLATLNAAAQLILPPAIRGRGLAIYLAATVGSMAVGSLAWGALADTFGISAAIALGAAGFVAIALFGARTPPISVPLATVTEGATA